MITRTDRDNDYWELLVRNANFANSLPNASEILSQMHGSSEKPTDIVEGLMHSVYQELPAHLSF